MLVIFQQFLGFTITEIFETVKPENFQNKKIYKRNKQLLKSQAMTLLNIFIYNDQNSFLRLITNN